MDEFQADGQPLALTARQVDDPRRARFRQPQGLDDRLDLSDPNIAQQFNQSELNFIELTFIELILIELTFIEFILIELTFIELILIELTFIKLILIEFTFIEYPEIEFS